MKKITITIQDCEDGCPTVRAELDPPGISVENASPAEILLGVFLEAMDGAGDSDVTNIEFAKKG